MKCQNLNQQTVALATYILSFRLEKCVGYIRHQHLLCQVGYGEGQPSLLGLWLLVTTLRSLKNVEIVCISFKLLTGEHFSSPRVYNHGNKEL